MNRDSSANKMTGYRLARPGCDGKTSAYRGRSMPHVWRTDVQGGKLTHTSRVTPVVSITKRFLYLLFI